LGQRINLIGGACTAKSNIPVIAFVIIIMMILPGNPKLRGYTRRNRQSSYVEMVGDFRNHENWLSLP
jgi:hypothetical protein